MYHRFPAESRFMFGWQLDHARRHYIVKPLEEIVSALREGHAVAPNCLAITADDGHRDFYDVAYPELKSRGLSATVFLTTGFLDGAWLWFDRVNWLFRNARVKSAEVPMRDGSARFDLDTAAKRAAAGGQVAESLVFMENADRDGRIRELERILGATTPETIAWEYAPLRWNEVREMAANGISFGAHTVNHPTLSALTERVRIDEELRVSKERVEQETNREAPVFCYPNGRDADITDAVVETARQCGFQAAVQTEPGLNTRNTDLMRLRRMAVDPGYDERYFERVCAVMRA
ncbi:MAG TPA: polysaccharide deacetylase family protein [Candidatus Acidoferrales bacterium]|jgi:peptidoglycan/xylan/chitin deacetylase (PgdA/CDA1 family)|nr:polysaccharide deacetylase family protein [Candidatus Acidoferrales bacterium]